LIIQLLEEDRYRIDEQHEPEIVALARQLVEAAHLDEAMLFSTLLQQMVQLVHAQGQPIPPEEFTPPDLEIPAPTTPLHEAELTLERAFSSL
jgi:hypothetical protein